MERDERDRMLAGLLGIEPEAVLGGFIVVGQWTVIADDGQVEERWGVHTYMDTPVSSSVGLLELAKLQLIAVAGNAVDFQSTYDDDDGD